MKICVVVPSEDQLATAGVRIRYQRIGAKLQAMGHSLKLALINDVQMKPKPAFDAYLICKCYDTRAIMLAAGLRSQGVHVGADFFDDYYSHAGDSRFVHLRQWLREIAAHLTFSLTSTQLMREIVTALLPRIPCHTMNDPYSTFDGNKVVNSIESKLKRVRSNGVLNIGWFGIGDNPYFSVGLADLHAFGEALAGFTTAGLSPRLSILTNRRALTVERLEMLARLPVPHRIEEWSEEAERQLINHSFVCFLPVNGQRFSAGKSLNRAVTALTGGAQVLSAGYPLYANFDDLIYSDSSSLVKDIRSGEPRLRRSTLPFLEQVMDRNANPGREARGLIEFLEAVPLPAPAAKPADFAVIHGRLSMATVHKFAQKSGHLSVAGPQHSAELNYDVKLTQHPESGDAIVQLFASAVKRLKPEFAVLVKSFTAANGKKYAYLPLAGESLSRFAWKSSPLIDFESVFLATYSENMAIIESILHALFEGMTVVVSESASPYWRGAPQRSPAIVASAKTVESAG